jgi:hypothetical protein
MLSDNSQFLRVCTSLVTKRPLSKMVPRCLLLQMRSTTTTPNHSSNYDNHAMMATTTEPSNPDLATARIRNLLSTITEETLFPNLSHTNYVEKR